MALIIASLHQTCLSIVLIPWITLHRLEQEVFLSTTVLDRLVKQVTEKIVDDYATEAAMPPFRLITLSFKNLPGTVS